MPPEKFRRGHVDEKIESGRVYAGVVLSSEYEAEDVGYDRWFLGFHPDPSIADDGGDDIVDVFADNQEIVDQEGVTFDPRDYIARAVLIELGDPVGYGTPCRFVRSIRYQRPMTDEEVLRVLLE